MPRVDLTLGVDVVRTPIVMQAEGIFDVPEAKRRTVDFHFDVPLEERPWQVGMIVGPSGAGKSVVARHLFAEAVIGEYDWDAQRSVLDAFGAMSIQEITAALSSVGFASPPAWMKPFHVLSNGERFRATLARALCDTRQLIVMDEFTSVVDRTVARIGAHAVAKQVRRQDGKRFVAVSCHDDIVEWLQPDWLLEPHLGRFQWRSPQRRPVVDVEVARARHGMWQRFAPHHYLTATLHKAARCFVGLVDGQAACFAGVLHFPHRYRRDIVSLSRIVVMPDFQGLGLGSHAFIEAIARIAWTNGKVLTVGAAHPALVTTLARSPLWELKAAAFVDCDRHGRRSYRARRKVKSSLHRRVSHFHWVGGGFESDTDAQCARRLWTH